MSFIPTAPQHPNARILAFKKSEAYPKPGSLISINSSIIEKHIKEIEDSRDPDDRLYCKIVPKLTSPDKSVPSFFYSNNIEKKYDIHSDMMLKVQSLHQGKKKMQLKCFLPMFIWPVDVEDEQKYIFFDDSDVQVVEPIQCFTDWNYSNKQPDNRHTFGIQVKVRDDYAWHLFIKEKPLDENFIQGVVDMGFKEFSYIAPVTAPLQFTIPEPKQMSREEFNRIQGINIPDKYNEEPPTKTVTTVHPPMSLEGDDILSEEDFDDHPMCEFVTKIYEITCMLMGSHGIIPTPEFREALRQKYINLTNNTDLGITFYDEDDE